MKKRDIVIVLGLIIFGFIYQAIEKGRSAFNSSFFDGDTRLRSTQFIEYPQQSQSFSDVVAFMINNPAGEIEVTKSADERLAMEAVVRVYHDERVAADAIAKNIHIFS